MTNEQADKTPFNEEKALAKFRAPEDAGNTRDPQRVSFAYSEDSKWRNRDEFLRGRDQIGEFLTCKRDKEIDYRLTKALWSFTDYRIAVRFQYEYHDLHGLWFRAYGNELREFDEEGLMGRREASINDVSSEVAERRFRWSAPGPRPADNAGIPSVR